MTPSDRVTVEGARRHEVDGVLWQEEGWKSVEDDGELAFCYYLDEQHPDGPGWWIAWSQGETGPHPNPAKAQQAYAAARREQETKG